MAYAELHCHSYFSLLDGASSPEALVAEAKALGLEALALTDHDSLAGVIRFQQAAKAANLHAVIGAEVTLDDGTHLTLLAENQRGYASLSRLISCARLDQVPGDGKSPDYWPGKVQPRLTWARLGEEPTGLIALSGCRKGAVCAALLAGDLSGAEAAAARLKAIFGAHNLFLEVQHHALPDDDRLLVQLTRLSRKTGLPLVATGNVHYANQSLSPLRDCLIATAHNESLTEARRHGHLPLNSSYHLKGSPAVACLFQSVPHLQSGLLRNSVEIARRCQVELDFSAWRLPPAVIPDALPAGASPAVGSSAAAPVPSEFAYLYELCHANLPRRYPELKPAVLKQLTHELAVIDEAGLAGYFLTVRDIIVYAKEREIRCQGRGSAANSMVAYLLGITNVDPLRHNLLFERFLSSDKFTMPDIDIDFAADRREEVLQYVYQRYGAEHTAMVCNVVTYRTRSALRDLAKALEFPQPAMERLLRKVDAQSPRQAARQLMKLAVTKETDAPAAEHPLQMLATLLSQMEGCPRHLSIHSGGMVITGRPLREIVPLEPATMPGRVVCQWDKESLEDAGLIKIDLLALRTLGLISEALEIIAAAGGPVPPLDAMPLDDPQIYAMLQQADTVGTFQVESRAQQQMLPRLKPTCFEDIVVEVAIVRPGPIQGGAVHPYLRRRAGHEEVGYLHPSLEAVLSETLGVLLFQEQAIRVAVATAGFTPGEADMLRRALSRNRSDAAMAALRQRFEQGATQRGMNDETAAAIFQQLAGFAGYGFCKSHAAGFALIAYQTLYLKRYHPGPFYCALLNHQPMGFYSPEVIIGDAQRHGITLLPPNVNRSDWRYRLEAKPGSRAVALRTGLSAVAGLGQQGWDALAAARTNGPFTDLDDLCRRTNLPHETVRQLIRAGALDAFGRRRALLWQLGDIDHRPHELTLASRPAPVELPPLTPLEQTAWEYELLGLSPAGQIMTHYRAALRAAGVLSTWQVKQSSERGDRVSVAGMVVVRQRPSTAKGILFVSLEDESGLLDLVIKPKVIEKLRGLIESQALLLFEGVVQRSEKRGGAANVLVHHAWPLGAAGA